MAPRSPARNQSDRLETAAYWRLMSEPSQHRFAPIALWRVASHLLATLFNLFGEPQALAHQHSISAKDHKLALNWLRCVEALFRKLLLIEASHYENGLSQTKPRMRGKRKRRMMTFFPDDADAWRATFRCIAHGRPRPRSSMQTQAPASTKPGGTVRVPYHSAWPIAERFEALLRVHNDPTAYAKRLARRLYANPQRIADMLREPPELRNRIDAEPYAEIAALSERQRPVFAAKPALNSS